MSNRKIIASILAVLGALLLGGSTIGSIKDPLLCYFFNQNWALLVGCPSRVIIISTILGIVFIIIALFLLLKDLLNKGF